MQAADETKDQVLQTKEDVKDELKDAQKQAEQLNR